LLPIIGFVLPCVLAGVIYLATSGIAHRPEQRGVLLVANVVLVVFAYPFFEVFFGVDGLARMAMFDVGNAVFAGSVALWLAQSFGTRTNGLGRLNWRRIVTSPLLVAAVGGICFALFDLPLSGPFGAVMQHLRLANTPLAMIAVGVFLEPKTSHTRLIGTYVGLRMALGGLLGWAAALALGMTGLDVVTACVGSAMPSGTTALVYAGAEGLDAEFAASLISSTLLVGIVVISVLPPLLVGVYGI
jgi:malate permease and related proteins